VQSEKSLHVNHFLANLGKKIWRVGVVLQSILN